MRLGRGWVQLALFIGLTVVHTWPLASAPARLSRVDNADTALNTWIVAWVGHQVASDPAHLFQAPIFYPSPDALAFSEHLLVPSLMAAPLTWAGISPIAVYNLLVLAGFALSGWTMSMVMTRWTGSPAAGILSGTLFAFNAHLLTRLPHVQALHVEFLPVALFVLDRLLDGRRVSGTAVRGHTDLPRAEGEPESRGVRRNDPRDRGPARDTGAAGATHESASAVDSGRRSAASQALGEGDDAYSRADADAGSPTSNRDRADSRGWLVAVALGLCFALQALCSNYLLVHTAFVLLVGVAVRPDSWLRHASYVWPRLLVAGLVGLALVAPALWPYYRVNQQQGLVRRLDEVARYSASFSDYLATAGRLHYAWWSHRLFEGRTALFPGVVATLLATIAIVSGTAWRDRRARIALAFGIAGVALSFGPALPGYTFLYDHLLLLQGLRAAARWGFLGLTAIAMLAGFGLHHLSQRWSHTRYWPVIVATTFALVTLESIRAPMGFVTAPLIPHLYTDLASEPHIVLAELPFYVSSIQRNASYLLNATQHFQPLVNGYSGFIPPAWLQQVSVLETFPADAAIARLRALGVTHVTVHQQALKDEQGTAALDTLSHRPDLDLLQIDGDVRLYRLR
jgi:hypothetical protein